MPCTMRRSNESRQFDDKLTQYEASVAALPDAFSKHRLTRLFPAHPSGAGRSVGIYSTTLQLKKMLAIRNYN